MSKEFGTILVHPPIASLSPNNPAGIDSLLRVVHGGLKYLDLNEGLLLDWFGVYAYRIELFMLAGERN